MSHKEAMHIHGKPVRDATKKLNFEITLDDREKGELRSQTKCAAALAICRKCDCLSAAVCLSRTYVEYKKHWDRYLTPPSLRSEVVVHDRDGEMAIGNYHVDPICESQKPETVKATRYLKNHPEMTDRTIADKSGADYSVVRRIRAISKARAAIHTMKPVGKRELESRGKAHSPATLKHGRPGNHRVKNRSTPHVRPVGANF